MACSNLPLAIHSEETCLFYRSKYAEFPFGSGVPHDIITQSAVRSLAG